MHAPLVCQPNEFRFRRILLQPIRLQPRSNVVCAVGHAGRQFWRSLPFTRAVDLCIVCLEMRAEIKVLDQRNKICGIQQKENRA